MYIHCYRRDNRNINYFWIQFNISQYDVTALQVVTGGNYIYIYIYTYVYSNDPKGNFICILIKCRIIIDSSLRFDKN